MGNVEWNKEREIFSFFVQFKIKKNNKLGGGFTTFKYRYRKQIIIIILLLLIIIPFPTYYLIKKINDKEELVEEKNIKKKTTIKKDSNKNEENSYKTELLSVDIKGEVLNPGIYSLKKSSRVIDVINLSGGLTEFADTSVINLSKKIEDEMVIIIYSKAQVENFKETKEMEKYLQDKCTSPDEDSLTNNACIESTNTQSPTLININTATKEELMSVSGIGEKKAEDIIRYREEKGKFNSIEEIKNIQGIGDAIFDKIKESITV